MSVELQATRGAFYLAVQPGRMAFSWHAILATGHLACGPGIFGSLCIAESPHPPNSLLYFSLSLPFLSFSHSLLLATCLKTTAVLCVAWRVSLYWLHGRGWLEDSAMIATEHRTNTVSHLLQGGSLQCMRPYQL